MKKLIIILTITILLTSSVALACGIKPIRPIMPIGCTSQWVVCINGQWVWMCQ